MMNKSAHGDAWLNGEKALEGVERDSSLCVRVDASKYKSMSDVSGI